MALQGNEKALAFGGAECHQSSINWTEFRSCFDLIPFRFHGHDDDVPVIHWNELNEGKRKKSEKKNILSHSG